MYMCTCKVDGMKIGSRVPPHTRVMVSKQWFLFIFYQNWNDFTLSLLSYYTVILQTTVVYSICCWMLSALCEEAHRVPSAFFYCRKIHLKISIKSKCPEISNKSTFRNFPHYSFVITKLGERRLWQCHTQKKFRSWNAFRPRWEAKCEEVDGCEKRKRVKLCTKHRLLRNPLQNHSPIFCHCFRFPSKKDEEMGEYATKHLVIECWSL